MDILQLIQAAFSDAHVQAFAWAGGAAILLDALIGAFQSLKDETFQLGWLYAFAKTKGTLYVQILATFAIAKAIPDFAVGDVAAVNPLAAFAAAEAAAFLLSLYASIRDNFTHKDPGVAPEGITTGSAVAAVPPGLAIEPDEDG